MGKTVLALSVALVFALSASLSWASTTIADWTFETSQPATAGPFSPEIGAGSATGSHAGSTVYSSPVGNGSAHSFSSNNWAVGDYYQFRVSTLGLSGIWFMWDQISTLDGPGQFQLSYSTNGSTFTTYSGIVLNDNSPAWNASTQTSADTIQYNLSSISALNNQATLYFRLTNYNTRSADGTGTTQPAGTSSIDNVVVGTPEPTSLILAGLGFIGLIGIARPSGLVRVPPSPQ